jgi:hypothetical protein
MLPTPYITQPLSTNQAKSSKPTKTRPYLVRLALSASRSCMLDWLCSLSPFTFSCSPSTLYDRLRPKMSTICPSMSRKRRDRVLFQWFLMALSVLQNGQRKQSASRGVVKGAAVPGGVLHETARAGFAFLVSFHVKSSQPIQRMCAVSVRQGSLLWFLLRRVFTTYPKSVLSSNDFRAAVLFWHQPKRLGGHLPNLSRPLSQRACDTLTTW